MDQEIQSQYELGQHALAGENKMVICILFSGIISGLLAVLAGLLFGFPIWFSVLLYPVVAICGAAGFISLALSLQNGPAGSSNHGFAAE